LFCGQGGKILFDLEKKIKNWKKKTKKSCYTLTKILCLPYVSLAEFERLCILCVCVCEFSIKKIKTEIVLGKHKKLLHAEFYDQYIGEFS
jgi:hypothetical protein